MGPWANVTGSEWDCLSWFYNWIFCEFHFENVSLTQGPDYKLSKTAINFPFNVIIKSKYKGRHFFTSLTVISTASILTAQNGNCHWHKEFSHHQESKDSIDGCASFFVVVTPISWPVMIIIMYITTVWVFPVKEKKKRWK